MESNIVHIARDPRVVLLGASSLAFAAGAGISFFVTRKQLETKYAKLSKEEIADVKKHYVILNGGGQEEPVDPTASILADDDTPLNEEDLEKAVHILKNSNYTPSDEIAQTVEERVEVEESISKNVFEDSEVDENVEFDFEAEKAKREAGLPFILHHDEFMHESMNDQISLTYFETDDILVDERDEVIQDSDSVVGDDNLTKFGYGSKDNNIVYVRNDKLEADYEIIRSRGSYAEEVLGFIQHDDSSHRVRKFRSYDE